MRAERDRLRRELQERGFEVVPDTPLPLVAAELETAVRALLERVQAAVHLVGSRHGLIPEGRQASLLAEGKAGLYHDPDLQIALAWREAEQPNAAWAAPKNYRSSPWPKRGRTSPSNALARKC